MISVVFVSAGSVDVTLISYDSNTQLAKIQVENSDNVDYHNVYMDIRNGLVRNKLIDILTPGTSVIAYQTITPGEYNIKIDSDEGELYSNVMNFLEKTEEYKSDEAKQREAEEEERLRTLAEENEKRILGQFQEQVPPEDEVKKVSFYDIFPRFSLKDLWKYIVVIGAIVLLLLFLLKSKKFKIKKISLSILFLFFLLFFIRDVDAFCCNDACYNSGVCCNDVWLSQGCAYKLGGQTSVACPGQRLGACLVCDCSAGCIWIPTVSECTAPYDCKKCDISYDLGVPTSSSCSTVTSGQTSSCCDGSEEYCDVSGNCVGDTDCSSYIINTACDQDTSCTWCSRCKRYWDNTDYRYASIYDNSYGGVCIEGSGEADCGDENYECDISGSNLCNAQCEVDVDCNEVGKCVISGFKGWKKWINPNGDCDYLEPNYYCACYFNPTGSTDYCADSSILDNYPNVDGQIRACSSSCDQDSECASGNCYDPTESNPCTCEPVAQCDITNVYWSKTEGGTEGNGNDFTVNNYTKVWINIIGDQNCKNLEVTLSYWEQDIVGTQQVDSVVRASLPSSLQFPDESGTTLIIKKSWYARWSDDPFPGDGNADYRFRATRGSDYEDSESLTVTKTESIVCGNGRVEYWDSEQCETDQHCKDGEYGFSGNYCGDSGDPVGACICGENLGEDDNITRFRIPNPCEDDNDGDDYGTQNVRYVIVNRTAISDPDGTVIISEQTQIEECVLGLYDIPFISILGILIALSIIVTFYLRKSFYNSKK